MARQEIKFGQITQHRIFTLLLDKSGTYFMINICKLCIVTCLFADFSEFPSDQLIQISMHQNYQESQFAPWNSQSDTATPFEIEQRQQPSPPENSTPIEPQLEQSLNTQSSVIIKRQDKYAKVSPKVYDKIREEINESGKKTELRRLEVMLKAINRNQLVIRVPQNAFQLPKLQIERPIKHSLKVLKRHNQTPHLKTDNNDSKNQRLLSIEKKMNGRWSELRDSTTKDSEQLTHNKSYVNILKKLNSYEQQFLNKCSQKNLKAYKQHDDSYQKIQRMLQKKQDSNAASRGYIKKERKHILDRILSRLQ